VVDTNRVMDLWLVWRVCSILQADCGQDQTGHGRTSRQRCQHKLRLRYLFSKVTVTLLLINVYCCSDCGVYEADVGWATSHGDAKLQKALGK